MPDSFWDKMSQALGLKKSKGSGSAEVKKCLMDLKDSNPDRRRSAAWTLGKLKPPPKDAIETLALLAEKDPDIGVRHSAHWALKEIRGS